MIDSVKYLNLKMMSDILAEFSWPQPYSLEDHMPHGILVSFPKSKFIFDEGPDGDVWVRFLSEDTGGVPGLHMGHALMVFVPLAQRTAAPLTPGLVDTGEPFPSEEKTRNEIRNACKILLTHLIPVIEGDFSWVDEYLNNRPGFDRRARD